MKGGQVFTDSGGDNRRAFYRERAVSHLGVLSAQLANAKTPQSADQGVQASGGCYLLGDDLFQVPMAQKAQLSPGGTIGPRKQKETPS
jgi:hypothetical protein